MTRVRPFCFALALMLAVAAQAAAQSLVGRVLDGNTRTALGSALVLVVDSTGKEYARTLTDSTGLFRFTRLPTKPTTLRVTRFGYAQFDSRIQLEPHELLNVDVPLSPEGIPAAPLVVTARRAIRDPRLAEFYARMEFQERAGFGHFLHREQLDSVALPSFTDYLARFARVPVIGSGDRAFIPGRGNCGRVQLFLDGVRTDLPINALPVGVIEGAEIYRSKAELPMEYGYGQAVNCGALLVWTRTGKARGHAKMVTKVLIVALAATLSIIPVLDLR